MASLLAETGVGSEYAANAGPVPWDAENLTGTTIVAATFDGGVVFGADSRTSTGTLVHNRVAQKITDVSDYMCIMRSGTSADTQAIAYLVRDYLKRHNIEAGREPLVSEASRVAQLLLYHNRDQLSAAMILGGWDEHEGGTLYEFPLGGNRRKTPVALSGSGSTYLYGFVDSEYREGMSRDEAYKFVVKAVTLAMERDGSSGGVCRTAVITKDGIERAYYTNADLQTYWTGL